MEEHRASRGRGRRIGSGGAAGAVAAGLGLLTLAAWTALRRRRAPALPETEAARDGTAGGDGAPTGGAASGSTGAASVAVLLPVRDEQANVLPCLHGLLRQSLTGTGLRDLRVVVVDDGSRDATRHLAAERAAGDPRLEVIDAGPLPAGWGGKVHALERGHRYLLQEAEAASAPPPAWILTTDADTRHHPRLLPRALAAAREHDLDLVSVAGRQEARGLAENLLTPPVFALLDTLLGDWSAAARGDGPPVANGQYMLFRTAALGAAGGFGAARRHPIDDVALAAAVRAAGGRTGFLRAPDLLRVRMYRGPSEVFRGWRRNLGGLFGGRPHTLAGALPLLLGPPLMALLAGPGTAGRRARGITWACGAAASALLRASSGQRPAWGLLYPLDVLALASTLALAAVDHRRGHLQAWKGRPVQIEE